MFLGIVVQNNDPQKRGRVKVFIPHLSLNLHEGWDNLDDDKAFEKLSDPKIKDVIDKIKDQLPWSNCAAPIMGENGNHYYFSLQKESKIGDNFNKTGDKPAKSIENTPPTDSFGNTYPHTSYSKSAKGLFSVPRVGSRVWVFFENGNTNRPVYFATAYNKSDWERINEDGHYPDQMENIYGVDGGDTTYQNKMVISQRGGVIEIINTDNQESIQISHYNGGFKIWSNGGTKEYVEGDDIKKVNGKVNLHIQGNADIFVDGTYDLESTGNMTFKAPRIDLNP